MLIVQVFFAYRLPASGRLTANVSSTVLLYRSFDGGLGAPVLANLKCAPPSNALPLLGGLSRTLKEDGSPAPGGLRTSSKALIDDFLRLRKPLGSLTGMKLV